MAKKHWLVTGANGLLGSNAGYFLGEFAHTIGTARDGVARNFHHSVQLDLENLSSIKPAIYAAKPDVILHCAAMTSHENCEENPALARTINAVATQLLAQSAAEIGAKFIYISTDAVFDGAVGNYSELDEPKPFSIYGQTKLEGERLSFEFAKNALVLRTNFFGWSPTRVRSILEFFVNGLTGNTRVNGYTDILVSSLYVQELMRIIAVLEKTEMTGLIHVTSSDSLTKFEFAQQVADIFELNQDLIHPTRLLPSLAAHQGEQIRNLSLSTTKIATILGHQPLSQREGIEAACISKIKIQAAISSSAA